MQYFFYFFSFLSFFTVFRVITHTNPIRALLFFIIFLLSISGMFFSLGSYFSGVMEAIIYASAIIVLFIFIIMLLNLGKKTIIQEKQYLKESLSIWLILIFLIFLSIFFYVINHDLNNQYIFNQNIIETYQVGKDLFISYFLIIELISILLLSALIIAIHFKKQEK